jgi:zinc protease
MKYSIIVSLFFILLLATHALALQVDEYVLDNGLKMLIVEDHKAPTATFQVWYRVGSRNEKTGKTGLSHLLEHMMFKGTKNYGPKTFSQTIQRAGGTDNAFTSKDYTGYFELLASDRISLPIDLEADRMQNLVLSNDSVLSERDVVTEERRLRYEDDPQSYVMEEVFAAAFKNHPYRWPVIGWMSDLKTLDPGALIEHYKTYYAPNNAVIIVVGDVNKKEIMEKVRQAFGSIPTGPAAPAVQAEEDEQKGERRVYINKEAELPYIMAVFKTPTISHEDGFALDVLGSILSDGRSSRLYRSLVYDKQIAISAWASYEGVSKDPFLFFAGATAGQGKKIEDVEAALLEELEKIKQQPPSAQEVRRAINQAEASFIMQQDSIYMQARILGSFEMTVGWRFIDKYLEGIRKVTPEDVSRVAKKYLIDEKKTTGVLVPIAKGARS